MRLLRLAIVGTLGATFACTLTRNLDYLSDEVGTAEPDARGETGETQDAATATA